MLARQLTFIAAGVLCDSMHRADCGCESHHQHQRPNGHHGCTAQPLGPVHLRGRTNPTFKVLRSRRQQAAARISCSSGGGSGREAAAASTAAAAAAIHHAIQQQQRRRQLALWWAQGALSIPIRRHSSAATGRRAYRCVHLVWEIDGEREVGESSHLHVPNTASGRVACGAQPTATHQECFLHCYTRGLPDQRCLRRRAAPWPLESRHPHKRCAPAGAAGWVVHKGRGYAQEGRRRRRGGGVHNGCRAGESSCTCMPWLQVWHRGADAQERLCDGLFHRFNRPSTVRSTGLAIQPLHTPPRPRTWRKGSRHVSLGGMSSLPSPKLAL